MARGDLGAELPFEDVPFLQNRIISTCWQLGRPVIVATNMLESMINNPTPTRAEVSDIAVAVREGADAMMLSGETANGKYPLKAIKVMSNTCKTTESAMIKSKNSQGVMKSKVFGESSVSLDIIQQSDTYNMGVARMVTSHRSGSFLHSGAGTGPTSISSLLAYNSICMANSIGAVLVVFTRTGTMATVLSHYRPDNAIYAFTDNEDALGRLSLYHGVNAEKITFKSTFDDTFADAINKLVQQKLVDAGDSVVLVQSGVRPIWRCRSTHILQVYTVGGEPGCDFVPDGTK